MIPPCALVAGRVDGFSTASIRVEKNGKGITGNDILRDFSGVKRIGTFFGKANNVHCEQFGSKRKSILTVLGCRQASFYIQYLPV